METSVNQLYVTQLDGLTKMALQQLDTRVAGLLTPQTAGNSTGAVTAEIYGVNNSISERSGRFEEKTFSDTAVERNWIFPATYDIGERVDQLDRLKVLNDPTSQLSKVLMAAINRKKDAIAIAGLFGTRTSGSGVLQPGGVVPSALNSTAFPAAQQIAINADGANSKLTAYKLQKGLELLHAAEVDEPVYCAINAFQNQALLDQARIVHGDYADSFRPMLDDRGRLKQWLGINFVHTERLLADSNTYTRVPLWVMSGANMCTWSDIQWTVYQDLQKKGNPWCISGDMTIQATRVEDKKVIEIKCLST